MFAGANEILDMLEQNMREDHQDRARQRARARQAEIAAEQAEAAVPDLSQFGTLVEPAPKRRRRQPIMKCTTIDLEEGVRTTSCF